VGPLYLFRVAPAQAEALLAEAAALYLDPRNRLLSAGLDSLTEADALSLLLDQHDHLLAARLLLHFGSLVAISRASLSQLSTFLSPGKAMRLLAAFRLAALCSIEQAAKLRIDGPEAIYDLFAGELIQSDREILAAALVDNRLRLIKKVRISIGTLNEALAHPREILKPAISHSAYAFALVHNHPSGDPTPSDADHRLTRRIHEASAILQIQFIDHVIIGQQLNGNPPFFSFKAAGLLT
jgi:DNA repair protein RadC